MSSPNDRSPTDPPIPRILGTVGHLAFGAFVAVLAVSPVQAADTTRVFEQGPLPPLGDTSSGPSAAAFGITARPVPAPGPLAACGQTGTPFVCSVSPTSIPVGGSATISWCDRSWAFFDGAYDVYYYIPYYRVNSGSWTAWAQQTQTQTTMSGTGNVPAGSTLSFFARAVGREFNGGIWTNKNYDSTVATLQITGGGGGGGGGGGSATRCGPLGTPFVSGLDPSTVNAGQSSILSWCDPSWAYLDGAFSVDHFDTYYSNNGGSSYMQVGGDVPAAYNGVTVNTNPSDSGSTYLFKVLAYGQEFSLGTSSSASRESSVSQLNVLGSGGGGGGGGGGMSPCVTNATTLCLHGNRFKVTVSYVAGGTPGNGNAVKLPGTDDSGYFWFFDSNNMEVVAKIASFCSSSGQYGFYVNGLTDLQLDVTLTDTKDGTVWHKVNANGTSMCKDAKGGLTCP